MPREASARSTSPFERVRKQIRRLLVNLRNEIRAKEVELARLKDEESKLSGVFGLRSDQRRRPGGFTCNWRWKGSNKLGDRPRTAAETVQGG